MALPVDILQKILEQVASLEGPLENRVRLAACLEKVSRDVRAMVQECVWPKLISQAPEVRWDMARDPDYFEHYFDNMIAGRRPKKKSVAEMWQHFVDKDIVFHRDALKEFVRVYLGVDEAYRCTWQYLIYLQMKSRHWLIFDDKFPLRLLMVQDSNRREVAEDD